MAAHSSKPRLTWKESDDLLEEMLTAMRVSTQLANRGAPGEEYAYRYGVAARLGIYINSEVEETMNQLLGQVESYLSTSSPSAILVVSEVVTDIVYTVEKEIEAEEIAEKETVEKLLVHIVDGIAAPEERRENLLRFVRSTVYEVVDHVCELKEKAERFKNLFDFVEPEKEDRVPKAAKEEGGEAEEKVEFELEEKYEREEGVEPVDFYHDRIKYHDAYAISYVEKPKPAGRSPESVLADHFIADLPIGWVEPVKDSAVSSKTSSSSKSSSRTSRNQSKRNSEETPEEPTQGSGCFACLRCFS